MFEETSFPNLEETSTIPKDRQEVHVAGHQLTDITTHDTHTQPMPLKDSQGLFDSII